MAGTPSTPSPRRSRIAQLRSWAATLVLVGLLAAPAPGRAQAPEIHLQMGFKSGDDFSSGAKVVFSPDGSLLAAVSGDRAIKIWETETGKERQTLAAGGSAIQCLAFSADNRRLVSAANDLTVSLWALDTGRQERTFRGHEDKIRCVDVSPDGTLAVSLESQAVKIWNLDTGRLVVSVPAPRDPDESLGTPMFQAAFSPDGSRVLFTTVRGELGVVGVKERRIVDTFTREKLSSFNGLLYLGAAPDGTMVLSVGSTVYHVDLQRSLATRENVPGPWSLVEYQSSDGRLTGGLTSADHTLHLIDGVTKRESAIVLKENVTSIGYSRARGQMAAASLGDHLDLYDLATGRQVQDFSAPALATTGSDFSLDGTRVSLDVQVPPRAGGFIRDTWTERWSLANAALEQFTNRTALYDDMQKLRDTGDPEQIKRARAMGEESASYQAAHDVFSPYDPQEGCFHLVEMVSNPMAGGSPLVNLFRIPARDASDVYARDSGNRPNWQLERQFQAHALSVTATAVSYGHDLIATGSEDRTINLFSLHDQRLLRTLRGHLGKITRLVFSPDGTRLLSESADLTSRLWDVATGRELGQFIRFIDGQWIVITPEGYYNASAEGDRHLDVRVGTTIYGIDNYREAFFRPDLVKLALSGAALDGYRTLADIKPPPRVSFVQAPAVSGSEDVTVTLRLEERGGGIGEVRLFLNGSAVLLDNGRGLKVTQREVDGATLRSYPVKLAPGLNTLRAVAFNADNSMQSNGATHQMTGTFTAARAPVLHALVIGIQEFRNPKLALKYSVADANLFAETLGQGAKGLFAEVKITLLTDPQATTRTAIVDAMQGFKAIRPEDVFILYLASHGTVDDGEYFLITANVGALGTERLKADALSQETLKDLVANVPCTKKLIVIDTCNAGQLGQAMQAALLTRGMSEDTAMKVLARAVGSTILSASTSVQEALEGYQGHGLFTWTLAQGLLGKADKGRSGLVQTTELAAYVESEVPDLAQRFFKREQFPTVSISGQGFPVGRVK